MFSQKTLFVAFAALLSLSLPACNKCDDHLPPPPTRTLHAAENALLGSWYVDERRDSSWTSSGNNGDTTVYGYTQSNYSDAYYLAFRPYLTTGEFAQQHPGSLEMTDRLQGSGANGFWYFDTTSANMVTSAGTVVSNNGTTLVIRQELATGAGSGWRRHCIYYYLSR